MNEPEDREQKTEDSGQSESALARLQRRRAEIAACEQDWMREDRLAQIDREIAALSPNTEIEKS